jgi:hypothetical protein
MKEGLYNPLPIYTRPLEIIYMDFFGSFLGHENDMNTYIW